MRYTDIIKLWLPALLMALSVAFFSMDAVWSGDAVGYAFYHPHTIEGLSTYRVQSLSDIWYSMVNHYQFTNGRFCCLYSAMVFVGLLPRWCTALMNVIAIIAVVMLCCRLAGITVRKPGKSAMVACLVWLCTFYLPYDPVFTSNYTWAAALNLFAIVCFFTKRNINAAQCVLLVLLGFVVGEWQESFSVPVAMAMLVYACAKRFRVSRVQWCLGIAYGIGTLVLCLAPAQLIRLETVNPASVGLLMSMKSVWPMLFLPLVYVIVIALKWRSQGYFPKYSTIEKFFLVVALTGYAMCIALKFSSGMRMMICASIATIILLAKTVEWRKRTLAVVTALLCVASVAAAIVTYNKMQVRNEKFTLLPRLYHESTNGRIYLPDRLFAFESRDANDYRLPWLMTERAVDPRKPFLRIYPESARNLDLDTDTNRIIRFMNQGWIILRSRSNPADFLVHRTLFPGLLDKEISPRTLNFNLRGDFVVDSTKAVVVGVYVNDQSLMHTELEMVTH